MPDSVSRCDSKATDMGSGVGSGSRGRDWRALNGLAIGKMDGFVGKELFGDDTWGLH